MHRHNGRRWSAGRVAGWAVVIGLYSLLLVVAADISAVDDGGMTASVGVVAQAEPAREPGSAEAALAAGSSESPLATLAIAGLAIAGAAAARAISVARRPRRVPVRPTTRRVTTLT